MTLRCGICGREFADEAALDAHEHAADRDADEVLACAVCGESFASEVDLVRHQGEDHVGVDPPDEERAVP